MRPHWNPFRSRSSEQQRDVRSFLRNFGAGVLELLPETLWDRPLVIRSAPGGGKTSLMRLFAADSLTQIADRRDDFQVLASLLDEVGAFHNGRPAVLGVMLSLDRDYRSILDLGAPTEVANRLFFRLLDGRIMLAVVRAAAAVSGGHPFDLADLTRVEFRRRGQIHGSEEAAHRLGGDSGAGIYEASLSAERQILEMLDSLLPVDWRQGIPGHADLYSLRLLSDVQIIVDGTPVDMRPLILLDDGHELPRTQRDALLKRLVPRELSVSRWYSERFEALSPEEILRSVGIEGRDYELLELERKAAEQTGRGHSRFEKLVTDIGNLRAARSLERYEGGGYSFTELLEIEDDDLLGSSESEIIEKLEMDTRRLAGSERRYQSWIETVEQQRGYVAARRWRELEILIEKDRTRPNLDLFDLPSPPEEMDRLSGSGVREAAALFLAREHRLPYYFGPQKLARLASHNIEQYLSISGDLFEEMLSAIMLNRTPRLSAVRQHHIIRHASERLWREIPRRLPHGHNVQKLLTAIVAMAVKETHRPTAPYAPGVTGTALSMDDRKQLLEPAVREKIPGADALFRALASAIAHNILSAELNRPVKGGRFMVLYLNRLLCPRFGLPLNRGGFREKKLTEMASWMVDPEFEPLPDEPSKELLPGWDRRQPGNTEQFLPVARRRSRVTSLTKSWSFRFGRPEMGRLCTRLWS